MIINWFLFIPLTFIMFILATIFGLYLQLYSWSEYYHEFTDDKKKYIKYAPIIYFKVIKKAVKTKDTKMLKYCLTNYTEPYILVGLKYCFTHGNFDLTYKCLSDFILE